MEADITIEYKNQRMASSMVQAVSVDNLKTPSGLEVVTIRVGNAAVNVIKCKDDLARFIATIDDLLFCISVAEKTIQLL